MQVISIQQVKDIFSTVQDIQATSVKFSDELVLLSKTAGYHFETCVGQEILDFCANFFCFERYIFNLSYSFEVLNELISTNSEFDSWLKKTLRNPELERLDLKDILILPCKHVGLSVIS